METHSYNSQRQLQEDHPELPYMSDVVFAETVKVGSMLFVGCLLPDPDPMDFWQDEGMGKLIEFRSRGQFKKTIPELVAEHKLFYYIDKYEHSGCHYSIAGTRMYPDDRWDVAHNCGVYIPHDEIQEQYSRAKFGHGGSTAARSRFVRDSNTILDSYSKWANGDVYGIIVKIFEGALEIGEESCWGFVGYDEAHQELISMLACQVKQVQP